MSSRYLGMESLEDRSKAARRTIVSSGMRVGRSGILFSCAGLALLVAAWRLNLPAANFLLTVGLFAVVAGLFPFAIGWSQSRQGAAFLRALSEDGVTAALLMDAKELPGDRRSLTVLLADGAHQTIALPKADAEEVMGIISHKSPSAEVGVREAAQRAVAQLQTA